MGIGDKNWEQLPLDERIQDYLKSACPPFARIVFKVQKGKKLSYTMPDGTVEHVTPTTDTLDVSDIIIAHDRKRKLDARSKFGSKRRPLPNG